MGGQIVDATVAAAPKQRKTEAERADLKVGRVPDAYRAQQADLAQRAAIPAERSSGRRPSRP